MKQSLIKYGLAFLIPFLLLFSTFQLFDIGINGTYDILMIDSYQQYIIFYHELKRMIFEQDWSSFFYNLNLGVGTPFIGTFGYYLSSPFSLFLLFFDYEQLPNAFFLITLIKISLCSVTFYFYLSQTSKQSTLDQLIFSCAYALMAYTINFHINLMWLDSIILFPLLIVSIDRLIQTNNRRLFFWGLILLFISNFYMAYMVGIAIFLYFIIQLFLSEEKGKTMTLICQFFKTTFLAIGCCGALLFPIAANLLASSPESSVCSEINDPLMLLVKLFMGSYDGINTQSSVNLYVGILPIIFLLYSFWSNAFSLKEKICYAGLLLFSMASCVIPTLYFIWHGFKFPIWFPGRFSFIISFFILSFAYRGFLHFKTQKNEKAMMCALGTFLFMIGIIGSCYIFNYEGFHSIKDILIPSDLIANSFFIILYLVFISLFFIKPKWIWIIIMGSCSIFELDINAALTINEFIQNNNYLSKESYQTIMKQKEIYSKIPEEDRHLYRIQLYDNQLLNGSTYYQQSSLSNFNTFSYRKFNQFLKNLSLSDAHTDVHLLNYNCYSPVISHLFGVKYSGLPSFLLDRDYETFSDELNVNPHVLPIGYVVSSSVLEDIHWESDPFKNQELYLEKLTGRKQSLFKKIPYSMKIDESLIKQEEGIYIWELDNLPFEEHPILELEFETQSTNPVYLAIQNPHLSYQAIDYSVTGLKNTFSSTSLLNFFYLNRFPSNKSITFKLFPTRQISGFLFHTPHLYEFDETAFDDLLNELHQNKLENLKITDNCLSATLNTNRSGILLLTLPYDRAWKATLNGKSVPLLELPNGLMGIEVTTGTHSVTFHYVPIGIKTGITLSIVSIGIVLFGVLKQKRNENKPIHTKIK